MYLAVNIQLCVWTLPEPSQKKEAKHENTTGPYRKNSVSLDPLKMLSFFFCFLDRQQEAQVHRFRGSCTCVGPLLHFIGSVCLVLPHDGQGVSLGVEDPVVEREVVILGEEQVEIPVGDRGGNDLSLPGAVLRRSCTHVIRFHGDQT